MNESDEVKNYVKRHPNYKGGTTDPRGYRLIFVGKNHHLADIRGYAYEHRLNAETMMGRKLRDGEEVHHKKEGKDGRGNNIDIEVFPNHAAHLEKHRKVGSNLRRWNEPNISVECGCGCGKRFLKYDESGRPRRYAVGCSARKGKKKRAFNPIVHCACGCGSEFNKYDDGNRERRFVSGHNRSKL